MSTDTESKPPRPKTYPLWGAEKTTGSETWDQKRRLADAMRLVIERLVPSNAPEAELRAAAEGLERYAEALKSHPRLRRSLGHSEASTAGDVGAFFDQSPLIGLSNPLAPPITVARSGKRSVHAVVTFGSAYEGPPGSVHGGFVAAAFDEVLGFAQSLSEAPGMTGGLNIRYLKPTPLHTELHFDAELVRVDGRKIFTEGRVSAGDVVTATAEGIFISVKPGKMEALEKKREAYEEKVSREFSR